jgi:hypothetical protein
LTIDTFVLDSFTSSRKRNKQLGLSDPDSKSYKEELSTTKQGYIPASLCEGLITHSQIKSAKGTQHKVDIYYLSKNALTRWQQTFLYKDKLCLPKD